MANKVAYPEFQYYLSANNPSQVTILDGDSNPFPVDDYDSVKLVHKSGYDRDTEIQELAFTQSGASSHIISWTPTATELAKFSGKGDNIIEIQLIDDSETLPDIYAAIQIQLKDGFTGDVTNSSGTISIDGSNNVTFEITSGKVTPSEVAGVIDASDEEDTPEIDDKLALVKDSDGSLIHILWSTITALAGDFAPNDYTNKNTPVDTDRIGGQEAGGNLFSTTWANFKTTLTSVFLPKDLSSVTEETSPADDDFLWLFDASTSTWKKVQKSNVGGGGIYDQQLDAYNNAGRIVAYDSFHDVLDQDPIVTSKSGHTYSHLGNGLKVVSGNLVATASGDASYIPITGDARIKFWFTPNSSTPADFGWVFVQDANNYVVIGSEYGYRWRITKVISGSSTVVETLGDTQMFLGFAGRVNNVMQETDIYFDPTFGIILVSSPWSRSGGGSYVISSDADVQSIINNHVGMGLRGLSSTSPIFHGYTIMQ